MIILCELYRRCGSRNDSALSLVRVIVSTILAIMSNLVSENESPITEMP